MDAFLEFLQSLTLLVLGIITPIALGGLLALGLHAVESPVKALNWLFDHRVIVNCEREPYLNRWYIFQTKHISLFLHQFVRSDEDRALHDHPWAFLVIPIWRGYSERYENPKYERLCPNAKILAEAYGMATSRRRRVWPVISTRYRPALYKHRVELINEKHAWSLFFHFRKEREWGFYPAEGFIQWNKWWQKNCE